MFQRKGHGNIQEETISRCRVFLCFSSLVPFWATWKKYSFQSRRGYSFSPRFCHLLISQCMVGYISEQYKLCRLILRTFSSYAEVLLSNLRRLLQKGKFCHPFMVHVERLNIDLSLHFMNLLWRFSLCETLFHDTWVIECCCFRKQDSSIGFGAPVRANMRGNKLIDAAITSSLLEMVTTFLRIP